MPAKYEPWRIDVKEGNKPPIFGIKILEGEFAGTRLSINEMDLAEDNSGKLSVDYTLIEFPEGKNNDNIVDESFNITLNEILTDIIEKALNEYENRNGNSSESSE